ncbi:hypothetical protein PISMIDRAFT_21184 [Pisolithus microcarpus 441]|uniref:Uncharacterized protein n=1 Tax=Pisolithus microcarpus 441 TaxID=765257 RepID=A0A0D0A6J2_9AGAM|nr:hypothetical protein PISMIDRAFT_21184 [Pisolithus microcarpus 441]
MSPVTYHWKKKAAFASETETTLEKMFISNPRVGSVEEKDHAGGFASFPSCRHSVVVKHDRRIARSAIKWSLQNIGILRTENSSGVASSLSALYRCWPPAVNLGYSISPGNPLRLVLQTTYLAKPSAVMNLYLARIAIKIPVKSGSGGFPGIPRRPPFPYLRPYGIRVFFIPSIADIKWTVHTQTGP